ncbi:MAG: hypothetical protein ABII82_18185 [Verrucomicrobiota bacterium]
MTDFIAQYCDLQAEALKRERLEEERIEEAYRQAVLRLRRLVEQDGLDVKAAINQIAGDGGIGLSTFDRIEREARQRYGEAA